MGGGGDYFIYWRKTTFFVFRVTLVTPIYYLVGREIHSSSFFIVVLQFYQQENLSIRKNHKKKKSVIFLIVTPIINFHLPHKKISVCILVCVHVCITMLHGWVVCPQ